MRQVEATITFKTKVRQMLDSDNVPFDYIEYKRAVSRSNCNLRPYQHDYFNSDLFPSMLQRAYEAAIGKREWVRLSELPSTVSIEPGFLTTVIVKVLV